MNRGYTAKFQISRILTATAVLLTSDSAEPGGVNSIVLGRAAYLIQGIWQAQYPKFSERWQINDFWKRVRTQAAKSDDIFELIIVCDQTINPPGCEYGENVQIQITTNWSSDIHFLLKVTAKKD